MKKFIQVAVALSFLASVPVYAESTSTEKENRKPIIQPSPACMQAAIDKRDNAIMASWTSFGTAGTSALTTRRDALKAAWNLTDRKERAKATAAAWSAFKTASRDARKTFNDGRRGAWKQFYTDRKACRAQGDDNSSEGMDSQL